MISRRLEQRDRSLDNASRIKLQRRTRGRRPGFDALEARTMLTGAPLKIASLGDSLTDEYEFYPPNRTAAQNWVEILSNLRGGENGFPGQVDFGAFSSTSRGETRNQGYAQNWARSGATSAMYPFQTGTILPSFALPADPYNLKQELNGINPQKGMKGLLTQTGGVSNINVVTLLIGGNDFADSIVNEVLHDRKPTQIFTDLFGTKTPGQQSMLTKNVLDPIKNAITQIENAAAKENNPNLHILVVTTPDVTDTPLVKRLLGSLGSTAGAAAKSIISTAAKAIDTAELKVVTKLNNPHVASLDVNKLFNDFINVQHSTIDGMYVDPNGAGPLARDLFVGDGFHPGAVAQGILAQAIAKQIDSWYTNAITPLSDAEIVDSAVANQPATSAELTSSSGVTNEGSAVTFTLTVHPFTAKYPLVTPDQLPFPNPSGNVTFLDSNNGQNIVLGTVPLVSSPAPAMSNGVATLTTTVLPAGLNVITAVYGGDTVYPPASPAAVQVIVS
jgi:lysophospholipase L1-like esterase